MLRVAAARAGALEAVRDLLGAFLAAIGEDALDEEAWRRIDEAVRQGRIRFFVAHDGDEAIGLCSLTICFSTYRASPSGVMEDFYVMPEHRGRGVARLLVEALQSDARTHGCGSVIVGCSSEDRPMWEHFGFRALGTMMATDP